MKDDMMARVMSQFGIMLLTLFLITPVYIVTGWLGLILLGALAIFLSGVLDGYLGYYKGKDNA